MRKDCSFIADAMCADGDDRRVCAIQKCCDISRYADAHDPDAEKPEGTALERGRCELMIEGYDGKFEGNE